MAYVVERHASFLVPSGSFRNEDAMHLHIVSTEPCQSQKCLLLNVSTIHQDIWHDPTCTLSAGCHEFVKADSYINYQFAIVKPTAQITKMIDGWVYHPKAAFKPELTDLILSGVRRSDMTPNYVLNYLDEIGVN